MMDALKIALKAADDKKANGLVALDISGIASFAGYFMICTGGSSKQAQAIADEIELQLRGQGIRPAHVESYRNAEWILMDYLDLVVHIFSPSARAFYDLERLWRDAKTLDVKRLLRAKKTKGAVVRTKAILRRPAAASGRTD